MNAIQALQDLSEQLQKTQAEKLTLRNEYERLSFLCAAKTREMGKLNAEFSQIIGLLTACRDALHELRCYDADFYDRTCGGLIPAIDTHLGLKQHEPEHIHPRTP